ncbi:hypothetical protein JCGZ_06915 [Jatropha curcas]|uniref:Uncharacterized protein n=1 Tax=Jatropha curcas TaxID=180498 RepID=A0A067KYY5_JATCU|nr:hypothetical protein JCGZ_06915 [Jatropha curcas]
MVGTHHMAGGINQPLAGTGQSEGLPPVLELRWSVPPERWPVPTKVPQAASLAYERQFLLLIFLSLIA